MYDLDETQGLAVFLLVLLLILVFAYCRLPLGGTKGGEPHPASTSPSDEKADLNGR